MIHEPPSGFERLSRPTAFFILFVAVIMIVLIMAGVFDPKPAGPLITAARPGRYSLREAGEAALIPLESPLVNHHPARYSVRLTGIFINGETDSGYGLVLGKKERIFIAVSPLGEAAVWQSSPVGKTDYHVPWQPWPHVRQGSVPNEIWVDVEDLGPNLQVTARINRELIWRGPVEGITPEAALWLAAFDGPSTVDMVGLEWFSELSPATPIGFAPTE
jgi:hypothetical protein